MANEEEQQKREDANQALDHAWNWFSIHATQRLQTVNFFLIATAFLTAAFVTAAKENMNAVAGGVAILSVLVSYFFYRMERRIRSLIHASENAIMPLQNRLAESLNVDALRIVSHVEVDRPGEWKYSKVFRYLYLTTGIAFGLGFFYVTWSAFSSTPHAGEFNTVVKAVTGLFLIVCGYEMVVGSPRRAQPDDQVTTARRWVLLILGTVFCVLGLGVLCHLAFVRL